MREMERMFLSTVARLSGRIDGLESGAHTPSTAVANSTSTTAGKNSARGSSGSHSNNNNNNNNNNSVLDKTCIYPPIPESTSKHPLRKALNYSQKSMVTKTTGNTKRS